MKTGMKLLFCLMIATGFASCDQDQKVGNVKVVYATVLNKDFGRFEWKVYGKKPFNVYFRLPDGASWTLLAVGEEGALGSSATAEFELIIDGNAITVVSSANGARYRYSYGDSRPVFLFPTSAKKQPIFRDHTYTVLEIDDHPLLSVRVDENEPGT